MAHAAAVEFSVGGVDGGGEFLRIRDVADGAAGGSLDGVDDAAAGGILAVGKRVRRIGVRDEQHHVLGLDIERHALDGAGGKIQEEGLSTLTEEAGVLVQAAGRGANHLVFGADAGLGQLRAGGVIGGVAVAELVGGHGHGAFEGGGAGQARADGDVGDDGNIEAGAGQNVRGSGGPDGAGDVAGPVGRVARADFGEWEAGLGNAAVVFGGYPEKAIGAGCDGDGGVLFQRKGNGGAAGVIDVLADEVDAAGSGPHAGGLGRVRKGSGEEVAGCGGKLVIAAGVNPVKHPRSP